MGQFSGNLSYIEVTDEYSSLGDQVYQLTEPLTYEDDTIFPKPITVPSGFKTDFASIPHWLGFGMISPLDPRWIKSAVIHDYMCQRVRNEFSPPWDFGIADRMLYSAMGVEGAPEFWRFIFWFWVNAFHTIMGY